LSPFSDVCILESRSEEIVEASAHYLGKVKFEIRARNHRIVCDQPVENGGSDEGMSPPEFLLASLASCAAYYAAQYLNARGLATDQLEVKARAEKAAQPARLGSFQIDVLAPGIDEGHQAGVLRSVKSCLIHNTLLGQPGIAIAVHSPVFQSS
jgi:putative redox protein